MNNPYLVLNVEQDANKKEIIKAQMVAMKSKKYPLNEISLAVRQLLNPAKRLAADFMYPTRIKSVRPRKISLDIELPKVNIDNINENAFDSLKFMK